MIIKQEQKDELVRRAQAQLQDAIANLRFTEALTIGEEIGVDGTFVGITNARVVRGTGGFRKNYKDKHIMGEAARRKISRRMKKAWAQRKKEQANAANGASPGRSLALVPKKQKYTKKHPHWTQTPAGRKLNKKILAKATRARIAKAREGRRAA